MMSRGKRIENPFLRALGICLPAQRLASSPSSFVALFPMPNLTGLIPFLIPQFGQRTSTPPVEVADNLQHW